MNELAKNCETLSIMLEERTSEVWALEAENVKLRELLRDMLARYFRPFLADDGDMALVERAHELGVAV